MSGKNNVIQFRPRRPTNLNQLDIPVPPTLEEAICYPGNERYVVLWWTRCGEDIVYDDGCRFGTGYSYGWLAFARHPAVAPILSMVDYNDYDVDNRFAPDRLLLDRYQRRFFKGSKDFVVDYMKKENNVVKYDGEPLVLTQEQLDKIAADMRATFSVSQDELKRRLEVHGRQLKQMLAWLDLQVSNME